MWKTRNSKRKIYHGVLRSNYFETMQNRESEKKRPSAPRGFVMIIIVIKNVWIIITIILHIFFMIIKMVTIIFRKKTNSFSSIFLFVPVCTEESMKALIRDQSEMKTASPNCTSLGNGGWQCTAECTDGYKGSGNTGTASCANWEDEGSMKVKCEKTGIVVVLNA